MKTSRIRWNSKASCGSSFGLFDLTSILQSRVFPQGGPGAHYRRQPGSKLRVCAMWPSVGAKSGLHMGRVSSQRWSPAAGPLNKCCGQILKWSCKGSGHQHKINNDVSAMTRILQEFRQVETSGRKSGQRRHPTGCSVKARVLLTVQQALYKVQQVKVQRTRKQ